MIIVGGGIIGLASAFRLARAGVAVQLFDPSPGNGATWAAAGMLAPSAEISPGEEDNFHRQRGSLDAWRALAGDLREVTGKALALHETGTLLVGYDASDRQLVTQHQRVAEKFGVRARHVTRSSDPDFFEGISTRVIDGLYFDGDGWLDPDEAVALLSEANERLGVRLEREEVLSASCEGDAVSVKTASGSFSADLGVLATGAQLPPEGLRDQVDQLVRPVRGMTVRVRGIDRSEQPVVRAFVRGRSFYLVSRPGGYCVLGASSDERRELVVQIGELQRLLRDGLDIVPSLEDASLLETRLGMRPASKDLEPFFEVIEGRWAWSSGYYRHGVTLAPLAALAALDFAGGEA